MKKLLFFLTLLIFNLFFSQNYNFSKTTSTYSNLIGATSVTNGQIWDEFDADVNLGFVFNFNNTNAFNFLRFSVTHGSHVVFNTFTDNNFIYVFSPAITAFVDRGYASSIPSSDISYKTEGVVGSRIFKLEWKNVGFFQEIFVDGISSDFMNCQLWLYEGSNIIEYHYGPSSISNPSQSFNGNVGIGVGVFTKYNISTEALVENSYILSGDPSSPTLNYSTQINYIAGVPNNGTVYRFTPKNLAVNDVHNIKNFEIFPTVTKDYINIKTASNEKIVFLQIFDNQGRLIKIYNNASNKINVQNLNSGVYNIVIKTSKSLETYKFIKE